MSRSFTMEFWPDGKLYVGRLQEVPGVFSQGETIAELEENLRDAYRMMEGNSRFRLIRKKIGVE